MKTLIVGGGIAGMAAAAFLNRQNHDVLIIDTAPEFRHIGFGLSLWRYGREVLQELGVATRLIGKEYIVPNTFFMNPAYKRLYRIDYDTYGDYRPALIHRDDLHKSLRETIAGIPVRFNTTIKSISQNPSKVTVEFSDGSTDVFDLVIGADGINSVVRKLIFNNPILQPYGWRAWFFWTDAWKRKNENIQILFAPGANFANYPLYDRQFAGFYVASEPDSKPDPIETRRQRLHDHARLLGNDIHELIDSLNMSEVYHSDLMRVPMGPWASGRVVLIGDGRHAISPVTGNGANIALEDASVLSSMIRGAPAENLPAVLQDFSLKRTRRVESLRNHLRRIELLLLTRSPLLTAARNAVFSMAPHIPVYSKN